MKIFQTAGRPAAARSLMASAGALSLLASSLTAVPAAFATPEASTSPAATASVQSVDANASYEDLTYAPAPDPAQVERDNPAMGAGERERMGTANARTARPPPPRQP